MSDIGKKAISLLPSLALIAEVAGNLAAIFPPAAGIISLIQMGIKVANGVANEVPLIVQTYDDIKAALAGGQPITEAQWATWEAMVNDAHAEFVAAAAEVLNKPAT